MSVTMTNKCTPLLENTTFGDVSFGVLSRTPHHHHHNHHNTTVYNNNNTNKDTHPLVTSRPI